MKKLLAMAVTAAFTVSMLAGCGQSAETTDASAQETTQETETEAADEETAGTADAASEDTAERTTFTVGFDAEFPPYGYMDENGEYVKEMAGIWLSSLLTGIPRIWNYPQELLTVSGMALP